MTRSTSHPIAHAQCAWNCTLDELDARALRMALANLMDQVAEAVFRKGLDLDDVLVRHLLICDDGFDHRVTVEARWLADAVRLKADVLAAFGLIATGRIRVTGLFVEAVVEA